MRHNKMGVALKPHLKNVKYAFGEGSERLTCLPLLSPVVYGYDLVSVQCVRETLSRTVALFDTQ